MSVLRCFLCTKGDEYDKADIETSIAPASKKPLKTVLQHLGNCIKTKLVFSAGSVLCSDCLAELLEYDNLMLNLLTFQRKLTNKLQEAITKLEFDDVDNEFIITQPEIAMEMDDEDEDMEFMADAFNPALDAKEELIEEDDVKNDYTTIVEVDDNQVVDDDDDWEAGSKRSANRECMICGLTFQSKLLLIEHTSNVHDEKVYTCEICGAVRRDEEYLELHMNLHEGKTENECRYCEKRFTRPVNVIRHMRKHWDKKKYQCEKCGERFSLDNMLYNHRLRHEAEENPVICSVCNQSFRSRKTYNHHVLIHKEDRPRHYCTHCPKSFTERYTLKMHLKTHGDNIVMPAVTTVRRTPVVVENEVETSVTTVCMTSVVVENEVETAVTKLVEAENESMENDESYEISCVICSSKFTNKTALDQHLQNDHDVILK